MRCPERTRADPAHLRARLLIRPRHPARCPPDLSANFPTNRQANKPTNRQTGKLASTPHPMLTPPGPPRSPLHPAPAHLGQPASKPGPRSGASPLCCFGSPAPLAAFAARADPSVRRRTWRRPLPSTSTRGEQYLPAGRRHPRSLPHPPPPSYPGVSKRRTRRSAAKPPTPCSTVSWPATTHHPLYHLHQPPRAFAVLPGGKPPNPPPNAANPPLSPRSPAPRHPAPVVSPPPPRRPSVPVAAHLFRLARPRRLTHRVNHQTAPYPEPLLPTCPNTRPPAGRGGPASPLTSSSCPTP